MARADERFLAQVSRLRRSARHDIVLRRLVRGVFFGCLAGAALAALGGTVRLPAPAALVAAAAVGIGAAAGAAAGLARRLDTRQLLLRADRVLASRELASAAWELAGSRGGAAGGLFHDAILEDAGRLLAGSHPRLILGRLRLPLLPFIPLLAALMLLSSLFPFDARRLFSVSAPPAREMAILGEGLEGLGRRLGSDAREQGGGRGLELARELERLGRDLQDHRVDRDEVLERVEGLRRGLAEEYSLRLRRYPSDGAGQKIGGEDGGGSEQGTGEEASSKGQPSGGAATDDRQAEQLLDAMNGLDELADRASGQRQHEGDPSDSGRGGEDAAAGQQGKPGDSTGSDAKRESGNPGPAGEAADSGSRQPGSTPVPDREGPPTQIAQSPLGKPLQADSAPGGDEAEQDAVEAAAMKLLVRSLPAWTRATTPEASVVRDYQRLAESSLAREEVPVELMPYVKSYFMSIGMGSDEH